MELNELLVIADQKRASDLHLTVGRPPTLRVSGVLMQLPLACLVPEDTESLARSILQPQHLRMFQERGEVDLSYSVRDLARYRVNVYRQRGSVAIALRVIPEKVPTIEELGLPPILKNLTERPSGIVIITGPAGSGKSTTLAAMVDQINTSRALHIVTLEDPIEYLHEHKMSIVNQREIAYDTKSFVSGLRAALREDPDVILVGEMRDLETIATAISAAETGHLVLATLHTPGAAQTVDRILDVFPSHQQDQIRVQLSMTLQAIVAQRLLTRADGQGLVVATEVLVAVPALRNLIREGKSHQIDSVIQTGAKYGMHTMESDLRRLFERGLITSEQYVTHARGSTPDLAAVNRMGG